LEEVTEGGGDHRDAPHPIATELAPEPGLDCDEAPRASAFRSSCENDPRCSSS